SPPVATTDTYITGILDENSDALSTTAGQVVSVPFIDNLGYSFTAQFRIEKQNGATGEPNGQYKMTMTDILDGEGKSIFIYQTGDTLPTGKKVGDEMDAAAKNTLLQTAGVFSTGGNEAYLTFDTFATTNTTKPLGKLMSVTAAAQTAEQKTVTTNKVNGKDVVGLGLNLNALNKYSTGFSGMTTAGDATSAVSIDFSTVQNIDNKGQTTINGKRGQLTSDAGAGCRVGEMSSISIGQDGKITASYTNGQTKLLGQIASASFANASGLEKHGDNLYAQTLNSGEAVINDITANGGSMTTGELEMSNVDLSGEFTDMITTQRGFQANSRIITVSDTMLEELINLKR
ncbi:MAG: flagellar hook-basal body complex protein, partial [Lachnospiraceae bacterium]|nr:flagellar hook-basal body complex protein [Lachnospiraceae bacterium]